MNRFTTFIASLLFCCLPVALHAITSTQTVVMANFTFTPATVTIGVGDTVIWTNSAAGAHASESTTGANCTASTFWDSTNVNSHALFSITFTNYTAGTYNYMCRIATHCSMGMKGVIIITNVPVVNQPPMVSLTSPAANAVLSAPASVSFAATASDDGTVTNVQFRVGTTVITNDTVAPYTAATNLPAGSYTLTAIAFDDLGATATNSINITVDPAPSVNITSPSAGTVFLPPANVTIQATATDDTSVSGVLFQVDGHNLTNDVTAPYTGITNNLAPGNHSLSAIATDNLALKSTNTISITVDNLPTISITNPVAAAGFRAPTNLVLYASVTDSDGTVTNVQFFSTATSLGNVTNNIASGSFKFTNINLSAGNYLFTAVARDNFGGATTSAAVNVFLLTNSAVGAPSHFTNGQTVITLSGIAGQSYTTEASSNLFNWFPLFTNTAPANVFNVTDFTSTNALQRFYRTRQDF